MAQKEGYIHPIRQRSPMAHRFDPNLRWFNPLIAREKDHSTANW